MISIERNRLVHATREAIFAALSDPDSLKMMMPRVQKVEMIEQNPEYARMVTHLGMPGFGTIRSEGELDWEEPERITYRATKPVPVEAQWILTAHPQGTLLSARMTLDLRPLLGPFASFVPTEAVQAILADDLDKALRAVDRLATERPHERAVAV